MWKRRTRRCSANGDFGRPVAGEALRAKAAEDHRQVANVAALESHLDADARRPETQRRRDALMRPAWEVLKPGRASKRIRRVCRRERRPRSARAARRSSGRRLEVQRDPSTAWRARERGVVAQLDGIDEGP
jgi:hypothetical protein